MDNGESEEDNNHHLLPRLRLELWVNGGVEYCPSECTIRTNIF